VDTVSTSSIRASVAFVNYYSVTDIQQNKEQRANPLFLQRLGQMSAGVWNEHEWKTPSDVTHWTFLVIEWQSYLLHFAFVFRQRLQQMTISQMMQHPVIRQSMKTSSTVPYRQLIFWVDP